MPKYETLKCLHDTDIWYKAKIDTQSDDYSSNSLLPSIKQDQHYSLHPDMGYPMLPNNPPAYYLSMAKVWVHALIETGVLELT